MDEPVTAAADIDVRNGVIGDSIPDPDVRDILGLGADQTSQQDVAGQAAQGETAVEPQKFRIKHNGQELEVTQDELVNYAQMGYDYTKKTTALSDERKALGEQVERFHGISSVLDDPANSDLLQIVQARARGERVPVYPNQYQNQNVQPQQPPTDPYDGLRLDSKIYEPQLANTVNSLVDQLREVNGVVKSYQTQQAHKAALDASGVYEQEFSQSMGRNMAPEEIHEMISFMHSERLDMTNPNAFRMAGQTLFSEKFYDRRLQADIAKLQKDRADGVVSRTPSSGVKPVPNGNGQMPVFRGKNAHEQASQWLASQHGLI